MVPAVYNFGDWDEFCAEALRHHEVTRPDERLLIHRIETCRALMSKDVRQYLGSLVTLHPRYNTSAGWDRWTEAVSRLLSLRHTAFRPWLKDPDLRSKTPEDAVASYKPWRFATRHFWRELDAMVGAGKLSSHEQVSLFQEALSRRQRDRLAEYAPILRADEAWSEADKEAQLYAEQTLACAVEYTVLDEQMLYTTVLGVTMGGAMFSSLRDNCKRALERFHDTSLLAADICVAIFALIFYWWVLNWLRRKYGLLKALRHELNSTLTI